MKFWLLIITIILAGCLPETGKEKTNCGANEAFDSVTRRCYSIEAPRKVPVANLEDVSLVEDSGINTIALKYADANKDYAVACNIISYSSTIDGNGGLPVACSCVGGICSARVRPDNNFNGTAQFVYTVTDIDGDSNQRTVRVTVSAVDDAPVASALVPGATITGTSFAEDLSPYYTVTLGHTDVEGDAATSCQINAISSNLALVNGCNCLGGGLCTVNVVPTANFFGNGEFVTYQVFANGQWSNSTTVVLNVTAVNDTPVNPNPATLAFELTEGDGGGSFDVTNGTDIDNLLTELVYNMSTAPTRTVVGTCLDNDTIVGNGSIFNCTSDLSGGTPYIQNLNDEYRHATIEIGTKTLDAGKTFPSIRYRAKAAGIGQNNLAIKYNTGGTAGAEVVTVSGNDIVIKIQDGVTTSKQIKTAIDAHATAKNLVEVIVLGSVPESSQADFFFFDHVADTYRQCSAAPDAQCAGAQKMTGGIKLSAGNPGIDLPIDSLQYTVTDPAGLTPVSPVTVTFNILPQDDVLDADTLAAADQSFTGDEDTTFTFNLTPLANIYDLTDQLTYRLVSGPDTVTEGTLKDCLDLDGSDGAQDLTCTFVPIANFSGAVACNTGCSYEVQEPGGDVETVDFEITVNSVDDLPIVCQYSTYEQAPECGLDGCIGTSSPSGSITPSSHATGKPVYFYSTTEKRCYYSTAATPNTSWAIDTNGYLASYEINQDEAIEISNIRVNEGSSDENTQSIAILNDVSSSNTALVPLTNITFSSSIGTSGDLTSFPTRKASDLDDDGPPEVYFIGDTGGDDDALPLGIRIVPISGQVGTSTITLTIADDDSDPENDTTTTSVSFTVTVSAIAATHKGWTNISALGPKLNKNGTTLDGAKVCSYSRTKCNTGGPCRGTTDPSGNATADEFNAIYLNEADPLAPTCFRAVAQKTIQDIKYTSKTDRMVGIEYVSAGSLSVQVFDRTGEITSPTLVSTANEFAFIRVNMVTGVTTTNQIISALKAHLTADNLISAENLSFSATQVVTAAPTALVVGDSQILKAQDIIWMNRSADPVTFTYVATAAAASFYSVSGRNITARFEPAGVNNDLLADTSAIDSLVSYALINGLTANVAMAQTTMTAVSDGASWIGFDVYCPITESDRLAECRTLRLGASCIGPLDPGSGDLEVGAGAPLEHMNESYYNETDKTCWRNYGLADETTWNNYKGSSSVTLSWEPFEVSSGAITGYNVYRKVSNHDTVTVEQTEQIKVNNTLIASTATSFTDNWQSSRFPPVPRTVYFYEVRPVVDGKEAVTNESFSKIRVLSPPANMSFVHRWMVNRNICQLMHSQERDDQPNPEDYFMGEPEDNYRCKYTGPGMVTDGGENYYDIGKDLIVDRFEAGCPYSTTGCVDTAYSPHDGTCIGKDDPNDVTAGGDWETNPAVGSIYYDRSAGKCWLAIDDDGGADDWVDTITPVAPDTTDTQVGLRFANAMELADFDQETRGLYRGANLPPISNVTQEFAQGFCVNHNFNDITGETSHEIIVGMDLGTPVVMSLPNRREQIAYSQWDGALSDSDIEVLEAGLSLNSSAKCNSSSADGLSTNFNTDRVPDVNVFYTLPGTNASNIRSFVSGSTQTSSCVSRYGIQDAIGNVAEYTIDRMRCEAGPGGGAGPAVVSTLTYGLSRCEMLTIGNDGEIVPTIANLGSDAFTNGSYFLTASDNWPTTSWTSGSAIFSSANNYRLDGVIGPCASSGGVFCDSPLTSWTIDEENHEASRMSVPMGLPFVGDFNESTFPSVETTRSIMEIGPSNGITSSQLHDDAWHFNTDHVYAEANGCGAMTAGGGYESQTGAGVWNLELVPCTDTALGYYNAYNLLAIKDMDVNLRNLTTVLDSAESVLNSATSTTIDFDNAETTSTFGQFGDNTEVRISLSGDRGQSLDGPLVTVGTLAPISADDFEDLSDIFATRSSVGFRCVGRIESDGASTHYYEDQ
jgi:hypothetical protein